MTVALRHFVDRLSADHGDSVRLRALLLEGLLAQPAQIAPRYFYDSLGSRLFDAITELPEYYPTRTERRILNEYAPQIGCALEACSVMADLGAGNCEKAALLLPRLKLKHYLAVDVSADHVKQSASLLAHRFPAVRVAAMATDFSYGLSWPEDFADGRPVFFYPGSSIGNFSPEEARLFLQGLGKICHSVSEGQGDLLIGVDMIKPVQMMEAAYADALGLTACFNLNALRHLNRLLDADFDVTQFDHQAVFNQHDSCIEMSLVSRKAQGVQLQGGHRNFEAGERICTERSYKYTPQSFHSLLHAAGFVPRHQCMDEDGYFLVCHATTTRLS